MALSLFRSAAHHLSVSQACQASQASQAALALNSHDSLPGAAEICDSIKETAAYGIYGESFPRPTRPRAPAFPFHTHPAAAFPLPRQRTASLYTINTSTRHLFPRLKLWIAYTVYSDEGVRVYDALGRGCAPAMTRQLSQCQNDGVSRQAVSRLRHMSAATSEGASGKNANWKAGRRLGPVIDFADSLCLRSATSGNLRVCDARKRGAHVPATGPSSRLSIETRIGAWSGGYAAGPPIRDSLPCA